MPREVTKVTETLEGWTKEFYAEEERALRGLGKYHLGPGINGVPSTSNLPPNLTTGTRSQVLLV